ncbi:MAG: c-type cytochrome [Hyphomicrobiaceae bacterium]
MTGGVVVVLLAGVMSGPTSAAEDLVARGAAIAAAKCYKCHAVGPAGPSPDGKTVPLRDLGGPYPSKMLVDGLKSGTLSGHEEMPQFDLGVDGVRAIAAYIDSLNPKGPHYLKGGQ